MTMTSRLYNGAVFVLYQLSLLFGIAMLPVALGVQKLGITLPVHRLVTRLGNEYDRASSI